MAVTTVIGSVTREELGIILPHEHIFINLLNQFKEPSDPQKQKLSREPISLANYGFLRRNPYAIRENVITLCRGAYRSGQSFVAALTERGLGLEFGQRLPSDPDRVAIMHIFGIHTRFLRP